MRHLRELTRLDSAPVVSEPAVRRRAPPAVVGAGSSGLSADHPTSLRTGCTAGRPVRPRKAKAPGLAGSPRPTSWHACRTPGRWRRSSPRWRLATRASLKGSSWYRRARPLPVPRHRRPGARGDHPQRPAARERARPLRARRFLPHARWARLPLRPPPRRSSGAGGGRAGDPASGSAPARSRLLRHSAVVWDAHLDGSPVSVLGIESRPLLRHGPLPADDPRAVDLGHALPAVPRASSRGRSTPPAAARL